MFYKIFFCCWPLLLSLCGTSIGQSTCANDTGIVVSIQTGNKAGCGVVVSRSADQFEVWTVAHVTGNVGRKCVVKYVVGCVEQIHVGEVVARRKSAGYDCAKIIANGIFRGVTLKPVRDFDTSQLFGYWFRPLGGWQRFRKIKPETVRDFNRFVAFAPQAISGQSGSPVIDSDHNLLGLVVGNRDPDTDPRGYFVRSELLLDLPLGDSTPSKGLDLIRRPRFAR